MLKIKKPLEIEFRKMQFLLDDILKFYLTMMIIGAVAMVIAYLWS